MALFQSTQIFIKSEDHLAYLVLGEADNVLEGVHLLLRLLLLVRVTYVRLAGLLVHTLGLAAFVLIENLQLRNLLFVYKLVILVVALGFEHLLQDPVSDIVDKENLVHGFLSDSLHRLF